MSIEVQAVQRIRAFSESTFGADSSASIGSFTDLPIVEGTAQLTLTRDELDPGQLVQHIDEGADALDCLDFDAHWFSSRQGWTARSR